MNPDTTPTPTWKVCKTFNSALLEDEKEGERLNEILCADSDEAECLVALLNNLNQEITEKNNEVARLREDKNTWREEANTWHQHYRDEQSKAQRWKQYSFKQEQEVERLRQTLEFISKDTATHDSTAYYRTLAKAALAPAPEEHSADKNTELNTDKNTEQFVSNSEWRELGPDEVIQEGDEVFTLGMWVEISPTLVIPINEKENDNRKFRTRRPLCPNNAPKPLATPSKVFK